jgi:hypothetical protein
MVRVRIALESTVSAISASVCAQMFVIFGQILAVPVYVNAWPVQVYASWILFIGIANIAASLDFGLSGTTAVEMIRTRATGDLPTYLWWRRFSIFGLWAILFAIATICVLFLYFSSGPPFGFDGWEILFFAASYSATLLVFNTYGNFLKSAGANSASLWAGAVAIALEALIPPLIVLNGGTIHEAAIALCSTRLLATIGLIWLEKSITNNHTQAPSFPGTRAIRVVIRKCVATFALPACMLALLQLPLFVIAAKLGPEALVIFATSRTLCRIVLQATFTYPRVALPELTSEFSLGNFERVKVIVRRFALVIWVGSALGTACVLLFGLTVYNFWTNAQITVTWVIFAGIALSVFFHGYWYTCVSMLAAINRHEPAVACLAAATTIYYLALSAFADSTFDVIAITLALEIFVACAATVFLRMASMPIPSPTMTISALKFRPQ